MLLRIRKAERAQNRDEGFTLVEVAIVLLIMGLLVAGILNGRALIDSAETRNLAQQFLSVETALHSYQDRYRAIPGDDRRANKANVQATVATTPAGMTGNGRIDGLWDSTTPTDESRLFWQHARLAGFLDGPTSLTDADYTPRTPFLTKMGISSTKAITLPTSMNGDYVICANDISARLARQLDAQIDDGNTMTGYMRVADMAAPDTALDTVAVTPGGKYLLCLAF